MDWLVNFGHVSAVGLHFSERIWLQNLELIETSYGCLVYLAGLLDPDTGRYEHYGSTTNATADQANRDLRRCHETIFHEWVGYPLEKKMADIKIYIGSIEQFDTATLIDAWLRLTPYKYLVPASIQGPERQKHISDFEILLGLLKNVYGVASPDPEWLQS
jgi:hypothetical protein